MTLQRKVNVFALTRDELARVEAAEGLLAYKGGVDEKLRGGDRP